MLWPKARSFGMLCSTMPTLAAALPWLLQCHSCCIAVAGFVECGRLSGKPRQLAVYAAWLADAVACMGKVGLCLSSHLAHESGEMLTSADAAAHLGLAPCRTGKLDPEKAKALGVMPGKGFGTLKAGMPVENRGDRCPSKAC